MKRVKKERRENIFTKKASTKMDNVYWKLTNCFHSILIYSWFIWIQDISKRDIQIKVILNSFVFHFCNLIVARLNPKIKASNSLYYMDTLLIVLNTNFCSYKRTSWYTQRRRRREKDEILRWGLWWGTWREERFHKISKLLRLNQYFEQFFFVFMVFRKLPWRIRFQERRWS